MKIDFICVGCFLLPLLSLIFCNQTTIKLDKIEILANLCNFKFLELGILFNYVWIWCISKKSKQSLTCFPRKIVTSLALHQSFVTTAPPPMGKCGDYDFSAFSAPPPLRNKCWGPAYGCKSPEYPTMDYPPWLYLVVLVVSGCFAN